MDCLQLLIPPIPQFVTIGHGEWSPGQQHFERRFDVYDMLFVARGALYMEEDGVRYGIEGGHMLVLEAGRRHVGYRPCGERTEIYWLHFVHPTPARRIDAQDIHWSSILRKGTDQDTLPTEQYMFIPKFAAIDLQPIVPELESMLAIHRAFNLFEALELHAHMARLLTKLQAAVAAQQRPSKSLQISRAAERYLRANMRQPFSSADLERALSLHFDYITRCLRKHTGLSPMKLLHALRVEEAKRLLAQTADPVPIVAEKVGIPDYNYFIRVFRRQSGQTPGAYRRERQGFV